ncbi:MAG TPA: hypothetical protein VK632_13110 [Verrucomicrobiae bacterium]|nr:hypothetical protein [Verrucomicrobiae bacterium]
MSVKFIAKSVLVGALLGAMACAPVIVAPLPQNVRRIAVLPPYQRDAAAERGSSADKDPVGLPNMTVGDVLAYQARLRLAEKGFEVLSPGAVKVATKDRAPTSPEMAAQILREANLDAVALYIEVRRWEPMPDSRGLKADGVIVALDVMMVDPKTGAVLWQVHRPSRPVPVYGVVLTGQANVIVAETVMREILR